MDDGGTEGLGKEDAKPALPLAGAGLGGDGFVVEKVSVQPAPTDGRSHLRFNGVPLFLPGNRLICHLFL